VAFLLDGVRIVLLKLLLSARGTKLDPLSGFYYYSPVCVLTLIAPVIYFEGETLSSIFATASPQLFGIIALNGVVAFSLNLSFLALLAKAGATTMSVASVIRDVFLTFFSALIFHTTITRAQVLGYFSASLGVKLWDEIKRKPHAFSDAFALAQQEKTPLLR